MAKNLDYTVISPSLLKDASIHPTSSRFSLGIIEELTEAYIQSLKRNLDDVCMLTIVQSIVRVHPFYQHASPAQVPPPSLAPTAPPSIERGPPPSTVCKRESIL